MTAATSDDDEADRIERELERIHLPLLEEAGLIEWDPESGVVSKGPRFGELEDDGAALGIEGSLADLPSDD